MRFLLAQTATAPLVVVTTAPAAAPAWSIAPQDLTVPALTFAGTALVLLLLMLPLRGLLRRKRLAVEYLLALVAISFYHALMSMYVLVADPTAGDPNHTRHEHILHFDNDISYWGTRLFAAITVYVGLRIIDRLAIVPLLTRGGRIAMPRVVHQIINIILALFAILCFGSWAFAWDIDKFLAGSAVVSIVLGLALQESLGNFFSGLVMQASPPFAIGDWIICGDHEGRVVDMNWRAVTIHTDDDNFIHIPNATVAKAEIVNYNAPTTATARKVMVSLESDVPPAEAVEVLKAAALETPGVQPKPEPFVYLEKFAEAVDYQVKFWISTPSDHHKIEHRVREHIWYRLRERNIILPNPVRTVEHVSLDRKARHQQKAAMTHRLRAVESVPLLAPLDSGQRTQLAELASEVFLTTGQILFRQGDAGDTFYIIYKGEVEVVVTPEGSAEERVVARLKAGDFFGEMSALTGQPRTATIRAAAPLSCVLIEKQDLMAIFQRDPAIMEKVSEIVARRNAEREAVMQGAGKAPAADAVATQQKSILGKMMRFFGLGKAA